jgi:hypothetical protein
MIQPLRNAHRSVFTFLSGALPLLIVAGLIARHPEAVTRRPKPVLTGNFLVSQKRLVEIQVESQKLIVLAKEDYNYPETLVYLSGSKVVDSNSRLLGTFNANNLNTYELPILDSSSRVVVFYSPALSAVIDTAELAGVK